MCQAHYVRVRTHGSPGSPRVRKATPRDPDAAAGCKRSGCTNRHFGHGYCQKHHRTARRARELVLPCDQKCIVEVCDRLAEHLGYCVGHNRQWRKFGCASNMKIGKRGHAYGMGVTYVDGYRLVPGNGHPNAHKWKDKILEHRLIMATSLGRTLLPTESAHHKNGSRADNRLVKGHELHCPGECCNLELWSKAQPAGQRALDKATFGIEMIRLYATPEQKASLVIEFSRFTEDESILEHVPKPARLDLA